MQHPARTERTRSRVVRAAHPRHVAKETVLEGHAVVRILEAEHDHVEDDSVTGIRNGVLFGLVFWSLLALAFVYVR